MKCGRCGGPLIREELEDQHFLNWSKRLTGQPVCFPCFEKWAMEVNPYGNILETMIGGHE